ncbi:MAG TPA: SDR family oxidoreductase [Flavobacteriales bacterium]|nr:SDR family oxidoreductase [Flavobacteriales bacterium]
MDKKQHYALITGGTSGIGFELAKLFARDKYNLVIVGRNLQHLEETCDALEETYSIHVHTIKKDLFDSRNAFELYEEVKDEGIEVDVLVNNAGHGVYGEFMDTNITQELKIIELNISSLVILTKLFGRDMVKRRQGKILNVSSIASKSPGPWQSVYHGTKAFVQSFTEAVRQEIKDKGVTVTALLPGVTDTDFFRKAGMEKSKIAQDKDQMADPADVAKDGYEALMKGKDMVVSGFKNKLDLAIDRFKSDERLAKETAKEQEPVDEDEDEEKKKE